MVDENVNRKWKSESSPQRSAETFSLESQLGSAAASNNLNATTPCGMPGWGPRGWTLNCLKFPHLPCNCSGSGPQLRSLFDFQGANNGN